MATADGPTQDLHERLAALSARLELRARELEARKDSRAVFRLVFAMTAHIVRNLPHALLDVGLRDSSGRPHIHDFQTLNNVLGHEIQPIVDATSKRYGRFVRFLDRLGKPYDRIITNYGIPLSRGVAWYHGVRLESPDESTAAAASIEKGPKVVVDELLDPPVWSLRIALRFVRWLLGFFRK